LSRHEMTYDKKSPNQARMVS